jgi:hypothetical protein
VVTRARSAGHEIASQAGKAVEYTRETGSSVAGTAQSLIDRVQRRNGR